ncbi:MAG: aspartate aminotransferase family protein [Bacilli bacterium]
MSNYQNKIDKYVLPVIDFEENIIENGKGSYVFDTEGNKLLDMCGGQFCTIIGHSNSDFEKLFKNLSYIQHTNTATLTKNTINTYEKIANLMPELDPKIITLSTGAESIEFAMRYAKNLTGKTAVVSFDRGYHGLSLGAQTVTYGGKFSKPYIDQVYSIPTYEETMSEDEENEIVVAFENICKNDSNISSLFIEPVVGVGGVHKLSKSFAKKIRKVCDDYGVLLILDECQSGFGRCGSWFYYQALDIVPDIVVTAKGIGLGFPVSMVAVKGCLVSKETTVTHYSSHQNDPFSSEIIDFGIEYLTKHNLLEACSIKGDKIRKMIDDLKCPYFSLSRGDGLMVGFDLVIDGVNDYRKIGHEFRDYMRKHGCLIQGTNAGQTVRLLPNYEITDEEINTFIEILKECCNSFDFEMEA